MDGEAQSRRDWKVLWLQEIPFFLQSNKLPCRRLYLHVARSGPREPASQPALVTCPLLPTIEVERLCWWCRRNASDSAELPLLFTTTIHGNSPKNRIPSSFLYISCWSHSHVTGHVTTVTSSAETLVRIQRALLLWLTERVYFLLSTISVIIGSPTRSHFCFLRVLHLGTSSIYHVTFLLSHSFGKFFRKL